MIFLTKKAFENEMYNRINEHNFKGRIEDELYKLKDAVRKLQYKVDSLEQSVHQPVPVNIPTATPTYEPAPYCTNPNWKAPDFTCTAPTGKAVPNTGITTAANSEVKAE